MLLRLPSGLPSEDSKSLRQLLPTAPALVLRMLTQEVEMKSQPIAAVANLRPGLISLGAALAMGCQPAPQAASQTQTVAFTTEQVQVTVDNARISFITSNGDLVPEPLETWLVTGDVTAFNGGDASGHFFCWGTFTQGEPGTPAGFTAYLQRVQVDGQGTLLLTGSEMSTEPMVVIGGTGAFLGASGAYTVPAPADGADLDGDGEPELNSAPVGLDMDGDGDDDGTGRFEFAFNLILPVLNDSVAVYR